MNYDTCKNSLKHFVNQFDLFIYLRKNGSPFPQCRQLNLPQEDEWLEWDKMSKMAWNIRSVYSNLWMELLISVWCQMIELTNYISWFIYWLMTDRYTFDLYLAWKKTFWYMEVLSYNGLCQWWVFPVSGGLLVFCQVIINCLSHSLYIAPQKVYAF